MKQEVESPKAVKRGSAALRGGSVIGAEVQATGGVDFRVWAPRRSIVKLAIEGGPGSSEMEPALIEMEPEEDGYFSAFVAEAGPGTLYRYRLGSGFYPDPGSRFQPQGPHGPSQVVDPSAYRWTDDGWVGIDRRGQVIYETHIGTFTKEGTWDAAIRQLPALAELGVTMIELMPVNGYPGRFGWGYDGVNWFAPSQNYGSPDEMRRFVDRAHGFGIGVILDVVYNHFGPDGNYSGEFSRHYASAENANDWGLGINFDQEGSASVREFVLANVTHWISEYHLDGLRVDATQEIHDRSEPHILTMIARRAREAANSRSVFIVAENETQRSRMAKPERQGGQGFDALWNDDFHHVALVSMTARAQAYYSDYHGSPQEFISLWKRGYLYQGQRNLRQGIRRGLPTRGLPPEAFINYIQNHDQIANSLRGVRIHRKTAPSLYRALTAILLLSPGTPMLFQGQEFAASSPFFYFTDISGEASDQIREQRIEFLSQFPTIGLPEARNVIANPADPMTFERSKLDHSERVSHTEAYALHCDLLRLRREDEIFRSQGAFGLDGAVLAESAFLLRAFGPIHERNDRLILVNLGNDLLYRPISEPLLAPPEGTDWRLIWSSEEMRYGGDGALTPETDEGWRLVGQSVFVFTSQDLTEHDKNDGDRDDSDKGRDD